jgi:membrane protein involved in colicin uptake
MGTTTSQTAAKKATAAKAAEQAAQEAAAKAAEQAAQEAAAKAAKQAAQEAAAKAAQEAAVKAAAEKEAQEAAARTRELFERFPAAQELYFTSDGFAFLVQSDAQNHANTLQEKTVQTIKRTK